MVLSDTCRARSLAAGLTMGVERGGLELGHQLSPDPVRTTSIAPAIAPTPPHTAPLSGYAPPQVGSRLPTGALLRSRLCHPTGWDTSLSGRPIVGGKRAAKGTLMGVCAWSTRPASAVVASVPCANSVNGKAVPPKSRSPRECALASSQHRVCSPTLERLEPPAPSTSVQAEARVPNGWRYR